MKNQDIKKELKDDASCDVCVGVEKVFLCSDGPHAVARFEAGLAIAKESGLNVDTIHQSSVECTGVITNWNRENY